MFLSAAHTQTRKHPEKERLVFTPNLKPVSDKLFKVGLDVSIFDLFVLAVFFHTAL